MLSDQTISIIFGVFVGIFGWTALGLSISSTVHSSWIVSKTTLYGLWNQCLRNGTACEPISEASWILAVRAFSIMSVILILAACCCLVYSQCKHHSKTLILASIIYFLAGTMGIVGMIVYTRATLLPPGSERGYYGLGFILGWVSSLLVIGASVCGYFAHKYMTIRRWDNSA